MHSSSCRIGIVIFKIYLYLLLLRLFYIHFNMKNIAVKFLWMTPMLSCLSYTWIRCLARTWYKRWAPSFLQTVNNGLISFLKVEFSFLPAKVFMKFSSIYILYVKQKSFKKIAWIRSHYLHLQFLFFKSLLTMTSNVLPYTSRKISRT